jgi:RNA polymerase sigma-70 factor (ECF subfamily)
MPPLSRGALTLESEEERQEKLSALLASGQANHDEVFQRVVQEYNGRVVAFFRLRRFTPEDSEDLAQEVLLNVFRGLPGFRRDASLSTWIWSVTVRVWRNELRRRAAAKRQGIEVPLDDRDSGALGEAALRTADEPFFQELLRKERSQRLLKALPDLPPRARQCLLLRAFQDLRYHEIAAAMRVSNQTVRSQLHDARRQLEVALDEVKHRE